MVKVYFEKGVNSQLVAAFDSEEVYMLCLPALELQASLEGQIVTESVTEDQIEILDNQPWEIE